MQRHKAKIHEFDQGLIDFFGKSFVPFARFSIFLIFFWFGLIKLLGISPAGPLAEALVAKTVGMEYFDPLFYMLAAVECVIGLLFLLPRATRIVVPLLLFHMILVCSPLLIVPEFIWQQFGVPTLEGQYIIKNAVVVAVAIGIAASAKPLQTNMQD